jgi:hypothetical protein
MRSKRKTLLSTVVLVFALASVAAAYYFVAGLGEGEGHAKLGKSSTTATFPITLTFADELTPGSKEPVVVTFNNTTGRETDAKHLAITATTSVAGCQASWFTIGTDAGAAGTEAVLQGTSTGPGIPIPTGTSTFMNDSGHQVFVTFKEEATVDQTACSEATLTLHAVATP